LISFADVERNVCDWLQLADCSAFYVQINPSEKMLGFDLSRTRLMSFDINGWLESKPMT